MHLKLILGILCILSSTMAEVSQVVSGNELFGKNLYNIVSRKGGNLIASPFSAHAVLTMAYAGAAGRTAAAFQKVLGLNDVESAANEYHELMDKVSKINTVTFKTANKMFVTKGFGLKPAFNAIIRQKFMSEAQPMNFSDNHKSAHIINEWVEARTNKKIKDLIKPDMLDGMTRMVLVNAVYFKGDWLKKFNPDLTREAPFYLLDGSETKCNMMHINGKYKYAEDDVLQAKILEMPYKGEEVSMLIFLPNDRKGLKHLESQISKFDFANYDAQMSKWEVDVALPRFKIESEIPLNDVLKEMGLGVIFSDDADFSNIAENEERLKVSDVIQKAFIEVNEEGAEAAAATAALVRKKRSLAPIQEKKRFIVDRQFMCAIIANETRTIMFVGRIEKSDIATAILNERDEL